MYLQPRAKPTGLFLSENLSQFYRMSDNSYFALLSLSYEQLRFLLGGGDQGSNIVYVPPCLTGSHARVMHWFAGLVCAARRICFFLVFFSSGLVVDTVQLNWDMTWSRAGELSIVSNLFIPLIDGMV